MEPFLLSIRPASYRLRRPSGQAVVTIDGRDRDLGKKGPDSLSGYNRLTSKMIESGLARTSVNGRGLIPRPFDGIPGRRARSD